ncbi:MAG: DinB family protein [Flavobacteriales bacterium]|nr:DinB family protein [Flavobacteriales bacterium]
MENDLKLFIQTRKNIANTIEELSAEQLNKIPNGFSNSIIWNVAHVVVTQQLLNYFLSGNKMYIPQEIVEAFRKGTKHEADVDKNTIERIKEYLEETPILLKNDYQKGIFSDFKEYPTSYGFTLYNIEDAIKFNNTHEGLHLGYIMAMKKLV